MPSTPVCDTVNAPGTPLRPTTGDLDLLDERHWLPSELEAVDIKGLREQRTGAKIDQVTVRILRVRSAFQDQLVGPFASSEPT